MSHRKSVEELVEVLEKALQQVELGGKYAHYAHPDETYTIIEVALLEETQEPSVVYQSPKNEKLIWIRTLDNFLSEVEVEPGKFAPRFKKV